MSIPSKIVSVLLLFFITITASSQEIKKGAVYSYARKIVDTMASESMHGRGYVNGGDSIAANYLKTEFSKIGLKPFGGDYYQRLRFPINTFPGTIYIGFNLHNLKDNDVFSFNGHPGRNFIIDASCPSAYADFGVAVFDSTFCSEKAFKKFSRKVPKWYFILVDDRNVKDKNKSVYFNRAKINEMKAAGIIELTEKLTWSQSQVVSNYAKIQILRDSVPYSKSDKGFYDGGGGIDIKNKFIPNHQSQNVIGYIQGSEYPDSFIVYSAHYDHLGQMGKDVYFPGTNDNASGCAMLLNLAKYYAMPEHRPKCSIAFMAFCGEEVGLLGSKYYTEHPLFPLKNIKFLLNMDIMGTGEDGITVVNGTLFKTQFDKLKEINVQNNLIKDVKIRGKAANSDHYFFAENGVKACFIYTMGGIKAYHDIYDRPETLPLNEFEDIFKLITKFGDYLQN
ncbi:MAG TPA: M28 family peptidase [Bacteroidia bacterium]|jgi:hypothetical protein